MNKKGHFRRFAPENPDSEPTPVTPPEPVITVPDPHDPHIPRHWLVDAYEDVVDGEKVTVVPISGPRPLAPDRDPWEQQPQESTHAYTLFKYYRDAEPNDRSLAAVGEKHFGTRSTVTAFPINTWASYWRWRERALAYDRYVEGKMREALENMRVRSCVETATLGRELRLKAAEALEGLKSVIYEVHRLPDGTTKRVLRSALSPTAIAKLAEVGTKLERTALFGDTQRQFQPLGVNVNVIVGDGDLRQRAQQILNVQQEVMAQTTQVIDVTPRPTNAAGSNQIGSGELAGD